MGRPLNVASEIKDAISVQQKPLTDVTSKEPLKLKLLLTLGGFVPEGWKDAIYGRDGTGSASADNDWPD